MALPAEKGNQIWRVIDILNWGEDYFKSKGFESPKQEIEWLLCDLLNYKRIDLYVQFEQPIHRPQLKQLKEWIKRRIGREPLQYITGKTEFYGHKFNITADVLIPRPETERVVDVALYSIGNIKTPKVLEVGSGSGCIAIAMGAERNDALIESVDVSESAITQAEKNADLNELSNIDFKVMDFLKEIVKEIGDDFTKIAADIDETERFIYVRCNFGEIISDLLNYFFQKIHTNFLCDDVLQRMLDI
jgi:release factor glutamine methyltransferase